MIRDIIRQLGKDSLVYGLGGMAARAIPFLLVPVYTRVFSPAQYGQIELLAVMANLIGMIVEMRMNSAQSFYFTKNQGDNTTAQTQVVTAIIQWRLIWGAGTVLITTLLAPILNNSFFNGQLSWDVFAIAFSAAFFLQIMNQSTQVFRLLYKPVKFIAVTLGNSIGSAIVGLSLIVSFGMGVKGFFWGMLFGGLFSALCGICLIRSYVSFNAWHTRLWPKLIRFSLPLIPAGLAFYIFTTSDRWFISYFYSQKELGLYALGAKFSLILGFLITTFRQAWWPVSLNTMHGAEGRQLHKMVARLYLGFSVMALIGLTTISPYLIRWFSVPAYTDAYPIIGIIAWCSVFDGLYLIGVAGIWKKERTTLVSVLSGIAAILNLCLNFMLVPSYGGLGASLASAISFFIWCVATFIVSERLWRVGYDFGIFAMQISTGIVGSFSILYMYANDYSIVYAGPIFLVSIPILLFLSIPNKQLLYLINRGNKITTGES